MSKTSARTMILRAAVAAMAFSLSIPILSAQGAAPADSQTQPKPAGEFEGQTDVGSPSAAGNVEFDARRQTYIVSGGGNQMWWDSDQFHFAWKKVSGDATISANVLVTAGDGSPVRKAFLIIRQSLAPDSPTVYIAVHADGLTALQYRTEPGGQMGEVQSSLQSPETVRLEKSGDTITAYSTAAVAQTGWDPNRDKKKLHQFLHDKGNGKTFLIGTVKFPFQGDFYIGIGICANEDGVVRQALFSDVTIR